MFALTAGPLVPAAGSSMTLVYQRQSSHGSNSVQPVLDFNVCGIKLQAAPAAPKLPPTGATASPTALDHAPACSPGSQGLGSQGPGSHGAAGGRRSSARRARSWHLRPDAVPPSDVPAIGGSSKWPSQSPARAQHAQWPESSTPTTDCPSAPWGTGTGSTLLVPSLPSQHSTVMAHTPPQQPIVLYPPAAVAAAGPAAAAAAAMPGTAAAEAGPATAGLQLVPMSTTPQGQRHGSFTARDAAPGGAQGNFGAVGQSGAGAVGHSSAGGMGHSSTSGMGHSSAGGMGHSSGSALAHISTYPDLVPWHLDSPNPGEPCGSPGLMAGHSPRPPWPPPQYNEARAGSTGALVQGSMPAAVQGSASADLGQLHGHNDGDMLSRTWAGDGASHTYGGPWSNPWTNPHVPHQQQQQQGQRLLPSSSLSAPAGSLTTTGLSMTGGGLVQGMTSLSMIGSGLVQGPAKALADLSTTLTHPLGRSPSVTAITMSVTTPSPKKRASPAGPARHVVAYLRQEGAAAGAGQGGESKVSVAVDLAEEMRKATERIELHKQAKEQQAARVAAEEAASRQQRNEGVQRMAADKERKRVNIYAMNAVLRMCDAAQLALLDLTGGSQQAEDEAAVAFRGV